MDQNEKIEPQIWKALFEQGLMAVKVESEYGGSQKSFMSAIIVVEELAKIDPSVSVACDVQNTLVNTLFRKYATQELKEKYLPRLVADTVGCFGLSEAGSGLDAFALKTRAEKKEITMRFRIQRCGSPTPVRPTSISCLPMLTRARATRDHLRRHGQGDGRQEGQEVGYPCIVYLLPPIRCCQGAGCECVGRGGQGLQIRHRNFE
eukprot:Partr_v1_DN25895_c0_g2_i1_m2493 putative acyl-CoA dehydrogenase